LYFICSNVLALTNHFEIGDQNITLENYDQWLESLYSAQPDKFDNFTLESCNLQHFLGQVLTDPSGNNTDVER